MNVHPNSNSGMAQRSERSERWKGILCALGGVSAVSGDGALVRWAQSYGGSAGAILFAKAAFGGCMSMILALSLEGRPRVSREGWGYLMCCTGCQAMLTACFTLAFATTYAANVAALSSLTPLFSALLGRVILKEALPWRTIAALAVATLAVALMVGTKVHVGGGTHIFGNVCGVLAAVFQSLFLLAARCGLRVDPELPIPVATATGALTTAVVTFFFVDVFDAESPWFFLPILLGSLGFAGVQLGLSTAPRYTTAADIALVSLLGLVLAPLWVALFYDEIPPPSTIHGAGLLLLTLLTHEAAASLRPDPYLPTTASSSEVVVVKIDGSRPTCLPFRRPDSPLPKKDPTRLPVVRAEPIQFPHFVDTVAYHAPSLSDDTSSP